MLLKVGSLISSCQTIAALITISTLLATPASSIAVAAAAKTQQMRSLHHSQTFRRPAESDQHAGTIMAWPTRHSILNMYWSYPDSDVELTRDEIAAIAKAIAKYEPVQMFVLDPAWDSEEIDGKNGSSLATAKRQLGNEKNVTIHLSPNVDSLWARDTGPVFVYPTDGKEFSLKWPEDGDPGIGFQNKNTRSKAVGMVLNFNQWGKKNLPSQESYFAGAAAQALNKSFVAAPFTAEGGGIETDGEGTLIATESAILNPNRNPGVDKATMERYFADVFGVKKTIWLPGASGDDITDDHIDGIARFASPGVVLVSKPFVGNDSDDDLDSGVLDDYYDVMDKVNGARDAKGRAIKVFALPEPDPNVVLPGFDPDAGVAVEYVNFLVVNGAVILAKFGDEKIDSNAAKIVSHHFPGRVIEQVYLHQLALQGGGIHCATQQYYN